MCILMLSLCKEPFKFVVAFNRDERLNRRTTPLKKQRLPDGTEVYCGLDEVHQGTWLAISPTGFFAAVTNNRLRPVVHEATISRGKLVLEYIKLQSIDLFMDYIQKEAHNIANSNLVLGNINQSEFYWIGIHDYLIRREKIEPTDNFIITNGSFQTEWGKYIQGKTKFEECLGSSVDQASLVNKLIELLQDKETSNINIPTPQETELTVNQELKLSSIFVEPFTVDGTSYGTISSSVIIVNENGFVDFIEKTWYPCPSVRSVEFNLLK